MIRPSRKTMTLVAHAYGLHVIRIGRQSARMANAFVPCTQMATPGTQNAFIQVTRVLSLYPVLNDAGQEAAGIVPGTCATCMPEHSTYTSHLLGGDAIHLLA